MGASQQILAVGGGDAPAGAAVKWNSADKSTGVTLTNSDYTATAANDSAQAGVRATVSKNSGKYYFEILVAAIPDTGDWGGGFATSGANFGGSISQANAWVYRGNGQTFLNNSAGPAQTALAVNNTAMFAIDFATGNFWFGRNGTWGNSGDPGAGTNPTGTMTAGTTVFPLGKTDNNAGAPGWTLNAETSRLTYSAPSGFTVWAGP